GGLGFEFGGADVEETQYNRIRSLVNEELKQYFRPEFLNRLDEIIVFRQLTRDEVKEIAEIMLKEVFARMREKGIDLSVTEAFKERLVEEGYNPSYGARPLRRAVMRLLEDSLAEEFLSGRIGEGDAALVDVDESKQVVIRKQGAIPARPERAGAGAYPPGSVTGGSGENTKRASRAGRGVPAEIRPIRSSSWRIRSRSRRWLFSPGRSSCHCSCSPG
ncbi:MAG: hypothetical protein ACK55R_00765, partial [Cyanobacteriota bacterium]